MTGGRAKSCKIHEHAISFEISEICSNLKHQVTGSKLAGDFIKPPGKWDHHQNIEETIHHHILQYLPTTSKKKTVGDGSKAFKLAGKSHFNAHLEWISQRNQREIPHTPRLLEIPFRELHG